MAQVTEPRSALIVAHGSPSAPERPAADLSKLADNVARRLPGWQVEGATLAGQGILQAAIETLLPTKPIIYPLFMSDGWFVSDALPRRLGQLQQGIYEVMPPFGQDPALPALCLKKVRAAAVKAGFTTQEATLLIAAHGSGSDPRPRRVVTQVADSLARAGAFRAVRVGFLEQETYLREAARDAGPAICLPFFAGRAGHLQIDLPEALTAAEFTGPVLEPVGAWSESPEIIAQALQDYSARLAA